MSDWWNASQPGELGPLSWAITAVLWSLVLPLRVLDVWFAWTGREPRRVMISALKVVLAAAQIGYFVAQIYWRGEPASIQTSLLVRNAISLIWAAVEMMDIASCWLGKRARRKI